MTAPIPNKIIRSKGGKHGGTNIWRIKCKYIYRQKMFPFTYSYKGKILQVTGTSGEFEGVGIVIIQIGDNPVTITLYPSYLTRDNPQNTISTTAI